MRIYMDTCCYNRILDDRSNPINYLERNSVLFIIQLVEKQALFLYGSQILSKEIDDTPIEWKRDILHMVYSIISEEIRITSEIAERAIEICDNSNIRRKDSIHLACAESVDVDVFLTVDKKFLNNAKRMPAKVKVMNPTEFLMEVLYYGNDNN